MRPGVATCCQAARVVLRASIVSERGRQRPGSTAISLPMSPIAKCHTIRQTRLAWGTNPAAQLAGGERCPALCRASNWSCAGLMLPFCKLKLLLQEYKRSLPCCAVGKASKRAHHAPAGRPSLTASAPPTGTYGNHTPASLSRSPGRSSRLSLSWSARPLPARLPTVSQTAGGSADVSLQKHGQQAPAVLSGEEACLGSPHREGNLVGATMC